MCQPLIHAHHFRPPIRIHFQLPDNATRYYLKPTTRWVRWDSGNAFPSHLSVTMQVPALAIASGEMVASSSFFETKRVGHGSPFGIMPDFHGSGIQETWKRAAVVYHSRPATEATFTKRDSAPRTALTSLGCFSRYRLQMGDVLPSWNLPTAG